MKRTGLTIALAALWALPMGCGGDGGDDALDGVDSIVFIQRQPQEGGMGDIFQNMPYNPPARLVTLTPPTADGELEVICCDHLGPEFQNMDINGYDISFDATEIVFSGRLEGDPSYGIFVLDLATREVEQLPTDPTEHHIYPIFLPGDKIMFNTTNNVEAGAPQHRDEYERGTTTQLGTINRDGSSYALGPKNLSHMVHGGVLHDGTVVVTKWDHLQNMNSGHLVRRTPDMTTERELFGKEGTGVTNSYYKAVEARPGVLVAVGSSRDRTIQSGALLEIRMGLEDTDGNYTREISEANASYRLLTPQVPLGREPSSDTIGRYYSAYPLNNDTKNLLVTWSNGPVQSEILAAANQSAKFGIYLLDTDTNQRKPIYDDPDLWDLFPKPLSPREAPPVVNGSTPNPTAGDGVLIGSMNVYDSSLDQFDDGSIYGVRVIEGFSVEEGVPNDFSLAESEGAAVLGIARVQTDGSWAATIPANVPVHQQVIDHYGMSLRNEPIWISGAPGEARFCGGCHENRAATTVINPGITEALAVGAANLMSDVPRYDESGNPLRVSSMDAIMSNPDSFEQLVGIPWDTTGASASTPGTSIGIQAIFDEPRPEAGGESCASCHNGQATGAAGTPNPSYQICEAETGTCQTITFDLSGSRVAYDLGEMMVEHLTASHLSLLGPSMMDLEEAGLVVQGDVFSYVQSQSARDSSLIQLLNPPMLFDPDTYNPEATFSPNMSVRAFPITGDIHENMLSAEEYYMLITMIDAGTQFYSRENAPAQVVYQP